MIKEKEIEINITSRNITFYKNKGYICKNGFKLLVDIKDLNTASKTKITAICKLCQSENIISYEKYLINKNRHNYYGCRKCSRKKAYKTNKEIFGTEHPTQNEDIKKKISETNLDRYGVKTTLLEPKTLEKIKKTIKEKYGVDEILSSEKIRKKSKNTLMKKYGVDHFSKSDKFKNDYSIILWKKYTEDKLKNYNINNYRLDLDNRLIKIFCEECGKEYDISSKNLYQRSKIYKSKLCTLCNPIDTNTISDPEQEIVDLIKENYKGKIIQSDRKILKGKELDIYLPELNIAIEFNGLYWHNELYKEKRYHLDKTLLCKNKNIKLIHIFEDEWVYKKEIVKSRILNMLNKSIKIYARKCIIKEVDNEECKNFLKDNHIQGFVGSKVKLGLYYNEQLVSLMTFGSKRKNLGQNKKENEYELLRFCNILNVSVIGSASKLLKHFIKNYNPINITSYADRRWSDGNLYKKLNFKKISETVPNYYYIINDKRYNRFNFRKDVLVKEGYDPNHTEHDIMLSRNIYRIYDCGSYKYEILN